MGKGDIYLSASPTPRRTRVGKKTGTK